MRWGTIFFPDGRNACVNGGLARRPNETSFDRDNHDTNRVFVCENGRPDHPM
jgi:hypothetical protein